MKKRPAPAATNESHRDDDYGMPLDSAAVGGEELPPAVTATTPAMVRPLVSGHVCEWHPQNIRCNWDLTTFAGRARAVNAMNPGTLELGSEGRVELRASWYCIYPDEETDEETAELKQFTRTVLISPTGQTFRTTSEHIARKVPAIFALFTPEEVAVGLPIRISERKSRKLGQTYHALELVCPEDTEGR